MPAPAMNQDASIARAVAGDVRAQDELVARLYPQVSRMVHGELQRSFRRQHRWLLPLFSTADFVHDVLVQMLRGLRTFSGDEAALTKYLAAGITHRLIDAVRHHEAARRDEGRRVDAEAGLEGRSAEPSPFLRASLAEQIGMFRTAMEAMEVSDRDLLDARLVQEAEFEQVAAQLGYASANSARKAFLRAQTRLALKLRAAGLRPPGSTEAGATAEADA